MEKEINDFINITAPTTWKEVQDIVRAGKAPLYFNVGDQFVVNKSKLITITTNNNNTITLKVDNSSYIDACLNNEQIQYYDGDNYCIPTGLLNISGLNWRIVGKSSPDSTPEALGPARRISDYGLSYISYINKDTGMNATSLECIDDKINFADLKDYKEELAFDIIGFDHDVPTDTNYKHSMTLQLHGCYEEMAFDGKEATWYVDPEIYPEGLPPNTYQFTFSNKKYIFTTTKTVPPKGQLMFNFNVRAGGKITIYENPMTTEEFEVCAVTLGEANNILPSITNTPESSMVNSTFNSRFGLNTWGTSATRQWLNSSEKEWYRPLNNFDRPCISDEGINSADFSGFCTEWSQNF